MSAHDERYFLTQVLAELEEAVAACHEKMRARFRVGFRVGFKEPDRPLPQSLLTQCLAIIEPTDPQRCSDEIAFAWLTATQMEANPEIFGATYIEVTRRRMAAVAETLLEAAVFMREVGSMFCLMAPDDADEDQLEDAEREWFGVSDYLGKATFRVRVALAETRSERPCNLLQRFCAVFALRSLLKFSPQKPTLATDGGLAKLATILYEAATKTTDANLAATWRAVFTEA